MVVDAANIGTGTTIAFSTSTWAPKITKIDLMTMSREVYKYSLLNPADLSTDQFGNELGFIGQVVGLGPIAVEGVYDTAVTDPPIDLVAEAITITLPSGTTIVGSGAMTNIKFPTCEHGIMTFTGEIVFLAHITITEFAGT